MNPALSVIFFTSASGAGYGLLTWLGIAHLCGLLPTQGWFAAGAAVLAIALFTAGLMSSTLHLGHPERAWRAFSQWRSSWLSREGVMAVIGYAPALLFAWGCIIGRQADSLYVAAGVAAAICAMLTVFTTSMIYASLQSIPAWHDRRVPPLYLLFALLTGLVLLNALAAAFGSFRSEGAWLACLLIALTAVLKQAYWRGIDHAAPLSTAESATGLGRFGQVSMLQSPHTSNNYLLKEMGFEIARKHADKLRRLVLLALFVMPFIASLFAAIAGGAAGNIALWLALLATALGVIVERWLFFAEARHVVMLFYGRGQG